MIELFEVVNINLNSKHRQKGLEFLMLMAQITEKLWSRNLTNNMD